MNPSCISGTRKKDKVKDRNGCNETRRRVGVCRCDVSGNAEKCLCERAVGEGAFNKGATGVDGRRIPTRVTRRNNHQLAEA